MGGGGCGGLSHEGARVQNLVCPSEPRENILWQAGYPRKIRKEKWHHFMDVGGAKIHRHSQP